MRTAGNTVAVTDPNPLTLNPYLYTSGNPVNHVDSSGRVDWGKFGLGVAEVLLGIGTIGLGVTIMSLAGWTVVGFWAGGWMVLGGAIEIALGVTEIIHSF